MVKKQEQLTKEQAIKNHIAYNNNIFLERKPIDSWCEHFSVLYDIKVSKTSSGIEIDFGDGVGAISYIFPSLLQAVNYRLYNNLEVMVEWFLENATTTFKDSNGLVDLKYSKTTDCYKNIGLDSYSMNILYEIIIMVFFSKSLKILI